MADWFFNSTIISPMGDIVEPKPAERLHYLGDRELSSYARAQLALLRPSVTRASVEKKWIENGGFAPSVFILNEKEAGSDFVAVRIEWRPEAMPERIFADRNLRARWLKRNAPLPSPGDVAMRISRPYLSKRVID